MKYYILLVCIFIIKIALSSLIIKNTPSQFETWNDLPTSVKAGLIINLILSLCLLITVHKMHTEQTVNSMCLLFNVYNITLYGYFMYRDTSGMRTDVRRGTSGATSLHRWDEDNNIYRTNNKTGVSADDQFVELPNYDDLYTGEINLSDVSSDNEAETRGDMEKRGWDNEWTDEDFRSMIGEGDEFELYKSSRELEL